MALRQQIGVAGNPGVRGRFGGFGYGHMPGSTGVTRGYTGGGYGSFQPMALPVGQKGNPAYDAAVARTQSLNQSNYNLYLQNYGLSPSQIAANDAAHRNQPTYNGRTIYRRGSFAQQPGGRNYIATTPLGGTPPGQAPPGQGQPQPTTGPTNEGRELGGGYTTRSFNLPSAGNFGVPGGGVPGGGVPGGGNMFGGFPGGMGGAPGAGFVGGGGAMGGNLFPLGSSANKLSGRFGSGGGAGMSGWRSKGGGNRIAEIGASGEEQRKGAQQGFEHDTALAGQRYTHETGLLGTKADLNRQLSDQAYEQNVGMLGLTTDANKELGTHQANLQRGLTRDAASLNLQAARQQAQLGRGTMDHQARLQRQAGMDTAALNRAAQEHAAGLTEQAARSTFDRNLAMQQATHGLNLDTMGQAQALNQLSAQQAQDRGFAGANRMYNMMFGGEGGGMFGQMMDRFGGGNQPQGGGGNPQFGGMGNFAQTPAGQAAAYNYANNPFTSAMDHMGSARAGGPPGTNQGQGIFNANANMMADAATAANAGALAGNIDQAAYNNVMNTMGAMSGAGQDAATLAAIQANPGLAAQSALQAGAIQSVGNMFGGFA